MITLINLTDKWATGASQSGRDVLIALLRNGSQVNVLSQTKFRLPRALLQISPTTPPCGFIDPVPWPPPPITCLRKYIRWIGTLSTALLESPKRKHTLKQTKLALINSLGCFDQFINVRNELGGARTVLIVRESPRHFEEIHSFSGRGLAWALEAFSQFDGFIFVSSNCRDEWGKLGATEGKKTFYIPNCCREDLTTPLHQTGRIEIRKKIGLPTDRFICLMLASLQHRKGSDLLIDAMPRLIKDIPNIFFALVGPLVNDWSRNQLARVTSTWDEGTCRFFGARGDALEFIRAADLLVLPARAEAMPRVILEAMALGTPIVASDVDGIPELIVNGESGILFPIGQPDGLVNGIHALAKDRQLGQELAGNAYRRYWEHFARSHQNDRYGEFLDLFLNST